jgi:hypothetical protein
VEFVMIRFTVREIIFAAIVIACATGWFIDHQRLEAQRELVTELKIKVLVLSEDLTNEMRSNMRIPAGSLTMDYGVSE